METPIIIVFLMGIFSSMLVNNVILSKYLGICSFIGVSKKVQGAVGMGLAVTIIMLLATLITFPLYFYVLQPLKISHIDTIVFILVIAVLVQLTEMLLKRFIPSLYKTLGVYLPLIATNCAILGVAQINVLGDPDFLNAIAVALGSGVGYMLVMVLFTAIRLRLESSNVPKAFRGAPIAFITAGLMALAFAGFAGMFI